MRTVTLSTTMPLRVPDDYWTVPEAARFAGVTRETIHRWIKAGRLKSYKIAGIQPTLVRRDALTELLEPKER